MVCPRRPAAKKRNVKTSKRLIIAQTWVVFVVAIADLFVERVGAIQRLFFMIAAHNENAVWKMQFEQNDHRNNLDAM